MRRDELCLGRDDIEHAGLLLDVYAPWELDRETGDAPPDQRLESGELKARTIAAAAKIKTPEGYGKAFAARCSGFLPALEAGRLELAELNVEGRMVIGLGQKGVIEAGMRLDHTWGVPVIPGSALKGLAAATAHHLAESEDWRKGPKAGPPGAAFAKLFGTTEAAGSIIFHDAWFVPESVNSSSPIEPDVMTVHHKDYYQGGAAPTDMDSPTPIPFISVRGKYLLALEVAHPQVDGPEERLLEAFELLEVGLRELGIGAKTAAGYGRATLKRDARSPMVTRQQQQEAEQRAREARGDQFSSLRTATQDKLTDLLTPLKQSWPGLDAAQQEEARKALSENSQALKAWRKRVTEKGKQPELVAWVLDNFAPPQVLQEQAPGGPTAEAQTSQQSKKQKHKNKKK